MQCVKLVDIIDICYWYYKVDGFYVFEGGKNLVFCQYVCKMKVGKVIFDEVYWVVSEYCKKFLEKVVIYYVQNYLDMVWVVFMVSGFCLVVLVVDESFLIDVVVMDMEDIGINKYQKLVKFGIGSIIYFYFVIDIFVYLLFGKYILKFVDLKIGVIMVIVK